MPNYKGIIPALTLPLKADLSIDEPELRRLSQWLTTFKGISALMTNGHTGEVFSLTLAERAEVTRGCCREKWREDPHSQRSAIECHREASTKTPWRPRIKPALECLNPESGMT
jgi:hypothetical protein